VPGSPPTTRLDGMAPPVAGVGPGVRVDIWSDVICPWCYVGKRRLEQALDGFAHAGDVEVHWHSFELDPTAPPGDARSTTEIIAKKYGMTEHQAEQSQARLTELAAAEGIEFHLDRTRRANTFAAHRLLHFAETRGRQDELKEAMLAAYFTEGRWLADHDVLVGLCTAVGLVGDEARAVLSSDLFSDDVRADEQVAAQLGATGVPFFVIDRRYAVSGAQDATVFAEILQRAWEESHEAARRSQSLAGSPPERGDEAGADAHGGGPA